MKHTDSFTRRDIVQAIFDQHGGFSHSESEHLVNSLIQCLVDGFKEHDKVLISGFGTFYWKTVKKRAIQLPDGTTTTSHTRRKLWFQPARQLKQAINVSEED